MAEFADRVIVRLQEIRGQVGAMQSELASLYEDIGRQIESSRKQVTGAEPSSSGGADLGTPPATSGKPNYTPQ